MLDIYCERIGPEFLAEPFNAFTSFAFFISAWLIWKLELRNGKLSILLWSFIILTAAIGIGSFLFHTFATQWARYLDIVLILLFQFIFLWVYIRKVIKLKFIITLILLAIYVFFALYSREFPHLLNGSLSYAPGFLLLLILGLYHYLNKKREETLLLVAFAVFTLSLICRTLDSLICPYFPIGLHFLWHILTAILVYLLARALILNLPLHIITTFSSDKE